MSKILIQSRTEAQAGELKNCLEKNLAYGFFLSKSFEQTQKMLEQKPYQLVILDLTEFTQSELNFVNQLRQSGYNYPILGLAEFLDEEACFQAIDSLKSYFLEKPIEVNALRGLTRKLMVQRSIPHQKHRRYKTNQVAHIESYITAQSVESKMFNLSLGGAYFEASKKQANVGIGDLVRLQVPTKNEEPPHQMNGRVIWTTRQGSYAGGYGIGIEFIKTKDFYNHLGSRA